jgi:CRISPR-associated helicase Cas3/CRISPR-associated endonuclease Cas3-HD
MKYFAHTDPLNRSQEEGCWHLLSDHLRGVTKLAVQSAKKFGMESQAMLAGLLHDLGKYGDLFQARLKGLENGLDHWSAGAWIAVKEFRYPDVAVAIEGHHIGLQQINKEYLLSLEPSKASKRLSLVGRRLSSENYDELLQRLSSDIVEYCQITDPLRSTERKDITKYFTVPGMLDVRMLYSTLVDADFIDTEAHFERLNRGEKIHRGSGHQLKPDRALEILQSFISEKIQKRVHSSDTVQSARNDLLNACIKRADSNTGIFTLTAPTGSGKTLAMLAFALRHAIKNNLDRIILVIPYLTIIEQTAQIYRDIFKDFGDDYVIEDHSSAKNENKSEKLSGANSFSDNPEIDLSKPYLQQLIQNWDAPIVLTTNVQFFESLFSNRPSACRKLHNISNSVILFDEVQTFPLDLVHASLDALSHLSARYNSSIVFATATQPAFESLSPKKDSVYTYSWKPIEIVPPSLNLFDRSRRLKVTWPQEGSVTLEQIVEQISQEKSSLAVFNVKKHIPIVYSLLKEISDCPIFSLSTNMCPKHRTVVLNTVREMLRDNKAITLLSTQCIEAGVDVDFPTVFRAMGPLDAIAQAGGRCNRNGLSEFGALRVFEPNVEGAKYPSSLYEKATAVTEMLLKETGPEEMDIYNPELFKQYYKMLYSVAKVELLNTELENEIMQGSFTGVDEKFKVIDQAMIRVLVPYDREEYLRLRSEVEKNGISRDWVKQASPHSINLFKPRLSDPVQSYLGDIKIFKGRGKEPEIVDGWKIYLEESHYSPEMGLIVPRDNDLWMV